MPTVPKQPSASNDNTFSQDFIESPDDVAIQQATERICEPDGGRLRQSHLGLVEVIADMLRSALAWEAEHGSPD
jgi:hypothetical protein